jgi:curved DNA-binding protein CbpA
VTYYDELGLAPQASPEEIRETYRTLARLLHPDQYQEEKLKRAAEGQMKRLNLIYAELSDPERRKRYDQSLQSLAACGWRGRILPRAAHLAVAVALGAGAVAGWLARTLCGGSRPPTPAARAHVAAPAPAPVPVPAKTAPRPTAARRRAAPPSSSAAETEDAARMPAPQPLDPDLPALASLAPPPLESAGTAAPAIEPRGQRPRFSGRWLHAYVQGGAASSWVYPPEYIELVIIERYGRLRGAYRARFRILDRAVSPYVTFQFEGEAPASEAAQFPWTGPAGAHGAVRLHLLSENTLEVAWFVRDPGGQPALVSGAALLTRLREP